MNYVKVKILPRPYNIEFKCVGRLIFDINYINHFKLEGVGWKTEIGWRNSKEQRHRENGPASIWDSGAQWWCRYDKFHRENGPARIRNSVSPYWHLNGIEYSEEEFNDEIRRRNELRKSKNLTNTT